jgi:hypoxanthine phosphoribosyltransferase
MSRNPAPDPRRRARPTPGGDVARVLIAEDRIARRIRQLARRIERDFAGRDLVVVALLNGTVVFLADLIRRVSLPLRLDFIGVSTYGDGTLPGAPNVTREPRLSLRGCDVLLVDDILDSGRTLRHVLARIRRLRPRRVRVCVLLEKRARRAVRVRADYVGFQIPNEFVVGYGLDFAERHRNLPFVGILRPEGYPAGTQRR